MATNEKGESEMQKMKHVIKISRTIRVPDLTGDCEFDLYAILEHHGDKKLGFYTAQVKNLGEPDQDQWFNCSNRKVTTLPNGPTLHSQTAYIVFYMKRVKAPRVPVWATETALQDEEFVEELEPRFAHWRQSPFDFKDVKKQLVHKFTRTEPTYLTASAKQIYAHSKLDEFAYLAKQKNAPLLRVTHRDDCF